MRVGNTPRGSRRAGWRLLLAGLALLALAGCNASGSGGLNPSLGLAGSTLDHASNPPTLAANGPGGTVAFVYDNQIWLRPGGQAAPKQLTKLVLSNGASIAWGPLVWSETGKYIAFSIVQDHNLVPGSPPRTTGVLYYVDASNGQVTAAGTGSIHGHSYDWLGDDMLFFSSGASITLYDLNSQRGGPRTWVVVSALSGPATANGPYDYYSFSDLSVASGYLYYTRLDVRSPGRVGAIGTAELRRAFIGSTASYAGLSPDEMGLRFPLRSGQAVVPLGLAYSDAGGVNTAGAWQVLGRTLITEYVDSVDPKAKTVAVRICRASNIGFGGSCDARLLPDVGPQPLAIHPQLAIAPDGRVAFTGDAAYLSGGAKAGQLGWNVPPAWSPDGKALVATQLLSTTTEPNGVIRQTTALQVFAAGQTPLIWINGAQNLAWAPGG